jgi:hypothetical protein
MISHTHFASPLEASASTFPPKDWFVSTLYLAVDLGDAASDNPAAPIV